MCKPAAEVANITQLESHSTRARAMLLWRVMKGMTSYTARDAELLYQSTLDSISQSWCISHYPVSEYIVAGRREVLKGGLAPEVVARALERPSPKPQVKRADTLLLSSESTELGEDSFMELAVSVLQKIGIDALPVSIQSGALLFCLGAVTQAKRRAKQVRELIQRTGATSIITDGPETLWALTKIYPGLDMALPKTVGVTSLIEEIWQAFHEKKMKAPFSASPCKGKKVLFHDSGSAALLADGLAAAAAIQPGYSGPEEIMGTGKVFDAPRSLVDALGGTRVYSVWTRSLSKSCGADAGLRITYPHLARKLALQRIEESERLGAEMIVTDSPLCVHHLRSTEYRGNVRIVWLPQLFV
jgi:Fe-S oxidoreductase